MGHLGMACMRRLAGADAFDAMAAAVHAVAVAHVPVVCTAQVATVRVAQGTAASAAQAAARLGADAVSAGLCLQRRLRGSRSKTSQKAITLGQKRGVQFLSQNVSHANPANEATKYTA